LNSARRIGTVQEVVFSGIFEPNARFGREKDPSVFGFEWTQAVRLHDGIDRAEFVTEIYWKSSNRRVRVAFPTAVTDDTGLYSIPGGYVVSERYEMEENFLWSANGDRPALDFLSTLGRGEQAGIALFHKGTVSSRIEDGTVLMSLVRSPAFGHCLERYAQDYTMPYQGISDGGYHLFEYALVKGAATVEDGSKLDRSASAWNAKPLALDVSLAEEAQAWPIPSGLPAEVRILALKRSFDGEGWVLRVINTSAQSLDLMPEVDGYSLQPCDLLERPTDSHLTTLEPFRIQSYRLHAGDVSF
jgi:alpha-mannosidase